MPSKFVTATLALSAFGLLAACDPEPGTTEWCEMIKEKAAGDITANEATEFAKSCAGDALENMLNGGDSNN